MTTPVRLVIRPSRGTLRRARACLATSLLLTACQSTMSLEEAKKVTASFQGGAFVPPPRTITDVSALLERHAGTYRKELAADRASRPTSRSPQA